jgi:hypothetical protein
MENPETKLLKLVNTKECLMKQHNSFDSEKKTENFDHASSIYLTH